MWMLRVVDGPAAIAARGFPPAVSVSVPLEVHDQARPANSGRWQLTVADGKGALVPDGPVSAGVWRGRPASASRFSPPPPRSGWAPAASRPCTRGRPSATLRLSGLAAGTPDDDAALDAAFAATAYMLDDF